MLFLKYVFLKSDRVGKIGGMQKGEMQWVGMYISNWYFSLQVEGCRLYMYRMYISLNYIRLVII